MEIAAVRRRHNSPVPGQPRAKVENRRCKRGPYLKVNQSERNDVTLNGRMDLHSLE